MNRENRYRFALLALLLLTTLLSFALRTHRLEQQSLWWDEIYTAARSTMTVPELVQNLFESRVHLPLYFLFLQIWAEIGRAEFVLRYFSVIMGVLTIPLIYQTGCLLAGRQAGLLAAFLLTISPFHIWYSQEARMYTFLAFNALAANYFLLRLFRHDNRRDWIGYAVTLTLTLYSHYLGVLILIAHYVFFSLHYQHDKARFKRWFISAFVAGALFVAWFLAVFFVSSFTQASISWIAPVRWYEPIITLLAFSIGRTIDPTRPFFLLTFLAYLLSALVALFFVRPFSRKSPLTGPRLAMRLLLAWMGVPFLLVTLVSLDWSIPQQRFVYMDRYIISLLPAFILLIAWGATLLMRQRWAGRWLLLFGLAVIAPTWLSLHNLYTNPVYGREDWRTAVAHIAANKQTGDVLLLTPGQILPLAYYSTAQLPQLVLPDASELAALSPANWLATSTSSLSHTWNGAFQRVWLIEAFDNADTHGFPQTRNAAVSATTPKAHVAWIATDARLVEKWAFPGLRLTLYELQGVE
jgi:mannosyltransferase